ncbi:MAG TPA: SDR family NAD(P)-dependent oxidoreductase [Chitinophagaceae bacterium]
MTNELYTLITGASDGFGKALALECASRKMNVILVSLPGTGLNNLASLIEREFEVKVQYFEYDLTVNENYVRLFESIDKNLLRVNILINNAGIGGTHLFTEKDIEFYRRQIELNVMAPTLITHLFIDHLARHNHRGDTHILNVSSLASFFTLPRKQVYGGTKSYLLAFSKSLRRELRHKRIYVSTICPGGMNTAAIQIMLGRSGAQVSRWSAMDPEDVASIAIDQMLQKKAVIIPGKLNRLALALDRILPGFIKSMITARLMRKLQPATLRSPAMPTRPSITPALSA